MYNPRQGRKHKLRFASLSVAPIVALLAAIPLVTASNPAGAASCTITPSSWAELKTAFQMAPATGAVVCLGADISVTDGSNLSVPASSNVTLDLNSHSLVIPPPTLGGISVAAIEVGDGTVLTVDATGGGSLTATGAPNSAGIGGSDQSGAGTIIINGGTIVSAGGINAAGIGGGSFGSAGTVIINNGDVTATSPRGAGIGSGEDGNPGNVEINGGKITATGGQYGAGIGGGGNVSGGSVTVTGGMVLATGGTSEGAGIGGGAFGNGANVRLSGGDITAVSGGQGAGIGTGQGGTDPGSLTLVGAGTPTTGSGSTPGMATSPTGAVEAGQPGWFFTQTTSDGVWPGGPAARTHVVFSYKEPVSPPKITTPSLPNTTVGAAYNQPVEAIGAGPITFSVFGGNLPPGLSIDPTTGIITGVSTKPGTFVFTVQASNAAGSDVHEYTVVVKAGDTTASASSSSNASGADSNGSSAGSNADAQGSASGTSSATGQHSEISGSADASGLETSLAVTGSPSPMPLALAAIALLCGVGVVLLNRAAKKQTT